mmetsp:Transcript_4245/g.10082  ORF Transcript_4245/g.10082 Transcript_4245/m.10082 type:complete len:484 (+) Transcript_4245:75-1526(+)
MSVVLHDSGREVLVPVDNYIASNENDNISGVNVMDVAKERHRLAALEQALANREREVARREQDVARMKSQLEDELKSSSHDGVKKTGKGPDVNLDDVLPQLPKPRQISSRELEIGPGIGTGKFADVSTAWLRVPCAVKKMRGQMSQENLQNFQREASIMNACNHPNVIKLLGFCNDGNKYYLVQELVTGGNVHDRMHKRKQHLTYQQVVRVGVQVADGMAHLHSRNIVHRDIKPHNFVIDTSTEPAKIKLCDFGLARIKTGQYVETDGRLAGTPAYQAPEMLKLQPITEKVDQYSFAILLWEMITCQLPWWGKTFDEMVNCVTRLDERPAIPADCPEPLAAIIRDCWQPSPELRPQFEAVLARLRLVNEMLKGVPEFRSKVGPSKGSAGGGSSGNSGNKPHHAPQQVSHVSHHQPVHHGHHSSSHVSVAPQFMDHGSHPMSMGMADGAHYADAGVSYGQVQYAPQQQQRSAPFSSSGAAVYYL